jgi:hypothetical protein
MKIVVCAGMHGAELTEGFLKGMQWDGERSSVWVRPPEMPPYSPQHLLAFLGDRGREPLFLIAFSAGVVGAIGAARLWQKQGGSISGLIALDGWGVPIGGEFPIYRVSHDRFTHWSSGWLGAGLDSFYADPAVAHLDLWRSPQTVYGQWTSPTHNSPQPVALTTFITALLQKSETNLSTDTKRYGSPK